MSKDAKLRMVQTVLHWAWDPIGVRGIDEAADEYHIYAPRVLGMLEAHASIEEIADHLTRVVQDRIELPASPDKDTAVASMLVALHAIWGIA